MNSDEAPRGSSLPPHLLSMLLGAVGRSNQDPDAINLVRDSVRPLEELCRKIEAKNNGLAEVTRKLSTTFEDTETTHTNFEHDRGSLGFFSQIHGAISSAVLDKVDRYLNLWREHKVYVAGKITDGTIDTLGDIEQEDSFFDEMFGEASRAAVRAKKLLADSTQLYVDTKTELPATLKAVRESFGKYGDYLKRRFTKSDDKKGDSNVQIIRMVRGEEEERGDYVKVPLVDNNPVLTDVLLRVIDEVPQHSERVSTKSGKPKRVRSLSAFAVEEAAERIAALSDPKLLGYINEPSQFFKTVGGALETFQEVTDELEPHHKAILDNPNHGLLIRDPDGLRRVIQENGRRISREIDRIKGVDLENIVQHRDDIVPDNRREIDYFRIRGELFELLQYGMEGLAEIEDFYDRTQKAKDLVRRAVDLKEEMTQVMMPASQRKLRADKSGDNEYYVGRQHSHGQFHFERQPTPDSKMGNVIGASFDRAKKHLNEIIETGRFPRVMKLSAPGGKVRSNILLIGPYGCGKTELARAVCADERVVGASVSVANTLTAYMHESVGNVKRIYDQAKDLRTNARELKPVVLSLDEFDGWFASGSGGTHTETDMAQIENVFLEVLDGMEDYNGIITMGMTNNPLAIPRGILRRFRYVDVVGQLTEEERAQMLEMYLGKTLPLHGDVQRNYVGWARQLEDAPGDVVRKVVDEVHFSMVPDFLKKHPVEATRMERVLYRRENREGSLDSRDIAYVKGRLVKKGYLVTPEHVDNALSNLLKQPPIRMQIEAARKVYQDSEELMNELARPGKSGFGLKKKSNLFDVE